MDESERKRERPHPPTAALLASARGYLSRYPPLPPLDGSCSTAHATVSHTAG
jgi:hypothetical protein